MSPALQLSGVYNSLLDGILCGHSLVWKLGHCFGIIQHVVGLVDGR